MVHQKIVSDIDDLTISASGRFDHNNQISGMSATKDTSAGASDQNGGNIRKAGMYSTVLLV
jgi:hypothetical protein